ncbi:retropepsin-like aspartic protease [Pedobacter sp. SL55]|uniref:retropepsin-like aspartic protease n=1 Tax=Pedobacter sp. SL55 TaxID=2995161 RepID=UPI00226F65CF|nr:retropepsin-like aspartic protease [Pedobacter sp. SL55]WAC40821.1 retropepsin-like aspartic protease [Pedobacter sp. SL55]
MKIYKLILVAFCCFASAQLLAQSKPVATIPFEMVNGSIVLKVKINQSGKTLRLLFDTGADGMAIDQSLADSLGLKITRSNNASVVGGNMKIEVSDGNDVRLESGFVLKNQGIAIFPQMRDHLDGLIGNTMTRRYVTKVDFNKYELSLYEFDNYEYEKGGTIVPITIPAGLFIIPGNVEIAAGKSYTGNFVFDSGASYNLICFRPFVRQNRLLTSGFVSEYHAATVSMGISSPTFNGKANSFSFTNTNALKNLPITLMAGGGQNENWNPGFDGSIGMGIISRYNFTINRKKNEIYLTPNHSYSYPLNFVLGSYLLGFNLKGELTVQSAIKPTPTGETILKPRTKITAINNFSASALIKDQKKIDQLKALPNQSTLTINYVDENNVPTTITLTK